MGFADSLLRREVLPFYALLLTLALATVMVDALLHWIDAVWIGRYLGIPGVLLILGSFGYSLRKRGYLKEGTLQVLLRRHEHMAWAGALLILVHAGIHFNALLPWLAIAAMVINVCSGLTGKFLLLRARQALAVKQKQLQAEGIGEPEIEERLSWDSLTVEMVRQWRLVHFPITLAFAVLALTHILSIFLFWGWR